MTGLRPDRHTGSSDGDAAAAPVELEPRLQQAMIASALRGEVLPDPEEQRLSDQRDGTLLALAVVAHAHGATAATVRHATGQWPGATRRSLRALEQAGLVEREPHPHGALWFATAHGSRLGCAPYAVRLLAAAHPKWRLSRYDWALGKFEALGGEHGPPVFRPSFELGDVEDPGRLADAIRTGTHEDRAYAVATLIALDDPRSLPTLEALARSAGGQDEPLARQAAVALGHFNDPAAIQTLVYLAERRDSLIREAAARSLGRLKAAEGLDALGALLAYPTAPVRYTAARALARIGAPAAIPALAGALADPDRHVVRAARHALIQLGATEQLRHDGRRPALMRWLDARRAARHVSGVR